MTGQSADVQAAVSQTIPCKWFSSLISRDYFPVLEEGIFAKNTALNHVSSILVALGFSHLSSPFQHRHPPPSGAPAQPRHQLRVREGIYISQLQPFL